MVISLPHRPFIRQCVFLQSKSELEINAGRLALQPPGSFLSARVFMFFEDSWGWQGSLGREVARTTSKLPGPLLAYISQFLMTYFHNAPMVGMKGRSATWRVSHLFGGTEQVGKNRKQNYNPFGLKRNLRSVNVCFDGQETNFQVTGPELTACIQKCLQRTRSRTKVLSGKGREKNAPRPYFPKT